MRNLENMVERRQALKGQIAELTDAVKALDYEIQEALGGELTSVSVGQFNVSVTVKRTFKAERVDDLLPKKVTAKEREALKKPAQYDSAKIKSMYPDVYDQACAVSAPYVVVKG